jgi:hypothetical protein
MIMFTPGCGGGGDFATASATGTVLCDGKPVEGAMVYFEPVKEGSGSPVVGKQGFAWSDANGKFVISTYEPGGEDGAVIGKHRVRVGKGKSNCNCAMNEEADLMQVEVKAGEDNVFELVLSKKTGREKATRNIDEDDE